MYSVAAARDNLPKLLRMAESGTPVKISRRGKPVAVLLSLSHHERLLSRQNFIPAYQQWRVSWDDDIEESSLEDLRDLGEGREVDS